MIISPILLPVWGGGESDFAVDIVNLEDVALTLRLRYTLLPHTRRPGGNDFTASLNDKVRLKGRLMVNPGWTRNGGAYRAGRDVVAEAGAARHEGLYALGAVPLLDSADDLSGRPTLRGYFEIFVPMVPTKAGRMLVQLDHPARLLITVSHRAQSQSATPSLAVLPLASGRAEHLIEPERPVPVARTPVAGMTRLKRAARNRKRR